MNKPSTINIQISGIELTESELKSAYILSHYQRLGLKKLMAETANQKIALKYTPQDPVAFAQLEAELAGQLLILQHLLDLSDAYEIQVAEELKQQQDANSQ